MEGAGDTQEHQQSHQQEEEEEEVERQQRQRQQQQYQQQLFTQQQQQQQPQHLEPPTQRNEAPLPATPTPPLQSRPSDPFQNSAVVAEALGEKPRIAPAADGGLPHPAYRSPVTESAPASVEITEEAKLPSTNAPRRVWEGRGATSSNRLQKYRKPIAGAGATPATAVAPNPTAVAEPVEATTANAALDSNTTNVTTGVAATAAAAAAGPNNRGMKKFWSRKQWEPEERSTGPSLDVARASADEAGRPSISSRPSAVSSEIEQTARGQNSSGRNDTAAAAAAAMSQARPVQAATVAPVQIAINASQRNYAPGKPELPTAHSY